MSRRTAQGSDGVVAAFGMTLRPRGAGGVRTSLCVVVVAWLAAFAVPTADARQIIDLGSARDFPPVAVNNSRVVVGGSPIGSDNHPSPNGASVYYAGSFYPIPQLLAPARSRGSAGGDINDANLVVGYSTTDAGNRAGYITPHPFTWQFDPAHPTVQAPLTLLQLISSYKATGDALGVNDAGDVVGGVDELLDPTGGSDATSTRAVVWGHGQANLRRLEPSARGSSLAGPATDVNDQGTVIGVLDLSSAKGGLWTGPDYTRTALPARPPQTGRDGQPFAGHAINSAGDYVLGAPDNMVHPAIGVTRALPAGFIAGAIGDDQRVFGSLAGAATEVKADGTVTNLNTSNPPGSPFSSLDRVNDVNKRGDIIGVGTVAGVAHGFLLLADPPNPLSVALEAFTPAGEKLQGQVAPGDVVLVRATVANGGDTDLHGLTPTGGAPVLVDPKGTGGLTLLSGPTPDFDGSTLPAHASRQYVYALTASASGRAAVETQITDEDPDLGHLEGAGSLRFDIADKDDTSQPFDKALTGFLAVNVVDRALVKSFGSYHDKLTDQAEKLTARVRQELSAAERKRWFGGSGSKLLIGPVDLARARQEASAGATMAVQFPKATFHGHTPAELVYEYDKAFVQEVGKGVSKYVKGYADLGNAAKAGLQREWSEAMLSARYLYGTATVEEREQLLAIATARADAGNARRKDLYDLAVREIPRTIDNIGYLMEAADKGYEQAFTYPVELAGSLYKRQVALAPLLDSDPVKYQQESAKLSAGVVNSVLPVVLDTLIAKGGSKLFSAGKAYLVAGEGAAVVEAAEAAGTLTESGKLAKGASTLLLDDAELPHGLSAEEVAATEREGAFLKRNPHATVIQSTDAGKVYALPNLGGVPETTLDAKAEILKALEDEYFARTGKRIKLAEVLKPGTPLAKADGVAKTELTEPKTGKPEMFDAGMPEEGLGEANVWRNKLSPEKSNPDFANWSQPRQDAARKAWRQANVSYQEYLNPTDPTSKIARLKQCIGKLGRVPLDLQPIGSGAEKGLQRFVEAEFEEISYKHGTADVKLLRVKKYAVEVVDTNTGKVVNRRVVVDSKVALPQTPDADAVAVAKVIGTDASGQAILAPLARDEREFLMQRYVDKNVKARASGRVPELAEHGTTLYMDDASARAAGKLLPAYGVPFLGERIGRDYLARIAKFVAPKGVSGEEMLAKMLKAVKAAGGFGQHTVVVTSDSRFFGEVPFASW